MAKRIFKLLSLLIVTGFLVGYGYQLYSNPSTVRAFGDLSVDFGVPPGDPIFTVANMAPGDSDSKDVDVHNGGSVPRLVAVKGVRTGGVGADPKLETVLDLKISEGATVLYGAGSATGAKTVLDFFTESASGSGVLLNVINPGSDRTYTFDVVFPTSAGNEFQAKSVIFDLTFGEVTGNDVVINEVYYRVDSGHGLDSAADRGVTIGGINVSIVGNGANSVNNVFINLENNCTIYQVNNTNSNTNINLNSNTGKNKTKNNTNNSTTIVTGDASNSVTVTAIGGINSAICKKGKKLGQNDEWVELFNPTDHDINLKNYSFTDNSGIQTSINGNRILHAGEFALVAKDNGTWNTWTEPAGVLKIPLGSQIGDGLNNSGDRIILKNAGGTEIDRMSWGSDVTGFTPNAVNPLVPLGSSTERLAPGFDTDTAGDWAAQTPPSPGL